MKRYLSRTRDNDREPVLPDLPWELYGQILEDVAEMTAGFRASECATR